MFSSPLCCLLLVVCVVFVFLGQGVAAEIEEIEYRIISSFPSPGPSPQGLAWDGMYLWLADDSTDTIYKLNPLDGSVVSSFASPGPEPRGLTFDGTHLWCSENHSVKIFKIDSASGMVISSIPAPVADPPPRDQVRGLAWDGRYFWCAYHAGYSSEAVRMNPEDGVIDRYFYGYLEDLAFDGTYLWSVASRLVQKRELPSGGWIGHFRTPGDYPTGLTFDGTCLWLADSGADSLYQIQVTTTGVEEPEEASEDIPSDFVLHQNHPNPFNSATTITYRIDKPAWVCLTVFDVTGRKVRQLANQKLSVGQYEVRWDGKDEHGKEVGSGLYLYTLKADHLSRIKAMLLIR